MKKNILVVLATITLVSGAYADRDRIERREEFERRPHPDARWHGDAGWLIPAIIGGALVYGAANSQPRPPIIIQQPPPQQFYPIEPNQPQQPPYGYHWEQILDANCNCYRVVLVRN